MAGWRPGALRRLTARAKPVPRTLTWINTAYGLSAAVLCQLGGSSSALIGFDDFDDGYRFNSRARPGSTYDPAYPVCLYVVSYGMSPYYRCSYNTMDQCRAFANGQMCSLNPYYAGANAPVRRTNRRYYRQGARSPAPAQTRSYARPGPPIHYRATLSNQFNEPYYGASQGYAPGEKQRFLESVTLSD